jgi:hypothetical protein
MLTAFDAMEAAMNLSDAYIIHNTHKTVNFRWSQAMEAVIFEFGYWDKFDFNLTDHYVIYLDKTTRVGHTFKSLFEKIEEEHQEIEKMIAKENENEISST